MWFFQRLRSATSQHDDQPQHQDSQLQSDSSAVDNDKQVQVLAQDLKSLVLSSKDEVIDRYIQGQSVVTDEVDHLKHVIDEDHRNLVVKEAVNEPSQANSSSESEANNHWDVKNALIVDTKECRVSEERETGERCEIQDDVKIDEHKNGMLKAKHEIEIKDSDARSKIGSFENNGGDGREEGSVTVSDDGKSKLIAFHYPLRPDCSHYMRTGMCKFGSNCRFNHPHIGEIQPTKDTKKKMEEKPERHGPIECKPAKEIKKKKEEKVESHGLIESKETKKKLEENVHMHEPMEVKPTKKATKKKEENVEKHGLIESKPTMETKKKKEENMERHGPTESKEPAMETQKKKKENMERHVPIECKPIKETTKKKEENTERHGPTECKHPTKETKKKMEENMERHKPIECKHHMSSVGCKYGKTGKFNNGKGKNVKTPVVGYNFVGLPIRPGEKECPYYMRNGFCQHGRTCRLHHPDPVAVECGDAPTSYDNDGPQPNIPNMHSRSAPRTLNPTDASFVPMMYSPPQNMPPPNPDWYGFQAPAHLYPSSDWGPPMPPPFLPNNPPSDTNMRTHHQQPLLVSESPKRPDPPNCRSFMKTGNCEDGPSCKFRHPQSRTNPSRRRKQRVKRPGPVTQQSE